MKQEQVDTNLSSSQNECKQSRNYSEENSISSLRNSYKRQSGNLPYFSRVAKQSSCSLLPLVGYSLLIFALLDYIQILTPLRFTDFLWEFQTVGALVEHVTALLLGLLFVFYRYSGQVREWEKGILSCLSWVSLLVGLLYLLMVPLAVADTWRIYYANKAQNDYQIMQQEQQFQQIKKQLSQATTNEQIKQLLASFTLVSSPPGIEVAASKNQLLHQISTSEREFQIQADMSRSKQSQTLLKNSIKWNLGALVSGTWLMLIWHFTNWARNKDY